MQKTTKIALFNALIALSGAQCWGAAGDLNPETPIGSLALLYAQGSADLAPRILALASLDRKNLLQLALIGRKESERFPNLYQDARRKLFNQKGKFQQLLQQHNGDVRKALFEAAQNNKPWAIDYLVQNGADLNARDKSGSTALMWVAIYGRGAIVAQLIAARADVDASDEYGDTALMYAANEGRGALVAQLIAAGADLNVKNIDGITALMKAAIYGRGAIVAQLIAAEADLNVKDKYGMTALMLTAIYGHEAVVAQLIAAGADVNEKNNNDWTALIYAAFSGHETVAAQLITAGADVDEKNNYGETALSAAETAVTNGYNQACRDGARAIVDLLTRGR